MLQKVKLKTNLFDSSSKHDLEIMSHSPAFIDLHIHEFDYFLAG